MDFLRVHQTYPTVYIDAFYRKLYSLSDDVVRSIRSTNVKMSEMLVPVSMALLSEYDASYLGVVDENKSDMGKGGDMVHSAEEENRKRAIFDSMSPRRQKQILKKGYASWDPFQAPKDPIDIRRDKTQRTTQMLVREFLQTQSAVTLGNEYSRGVLEICLGIINENERYQGMFEFSIWYNELLKQTAAGGE